MPLRVESGSFHQSCPGPDGIRSIEMQAAKFFLNKEYFRWSSFQQFDKSLVLTASATAYLMSSRSFVNIV